MIGREAARPALGLAAWIALTAAAAATGARFLPGPWYAALAKPAWTPPDAVFAPVWTTLYALMAIAAWLVWRRHGWRGAAAALWLYVAQLALNALWSWLFFGLHRPDLAFADVAALELAILGTLLLFWRKHRAAGALLLPYAAWVGFASVLNFAVWRLNAA